MAYSLDDLIDSVRQSRQHFLKHVGGLTPDQWQWKPYPECKSAAETLAHLVADDRAFLQTIQSGQEPDYENLQEAERDPAVLLHILATTHEQLLGYLKRTYADTPIDEEIPFHGLQMKLATAVNMISSEDYYHAGQIAYIRMATDPTWDYYATIYG